MRMLIHYIYKITLLCGSLAGCYYIGKHTTSNIKDKYAGSGRIVKDYYKKYGKIENETYTKEILEYNESFEINCEREKEIIGTLYINDILCLNLKSGGENGHYSDTAKQHISEGVKLAHTDRKLFGTGFTGRQHSNDTKTKIASKLKGKSYLTEAGREKLKTTGHKNKGRIHTEEARSRMSAAHKGKHPWNYGLKLKTL